MAIRISNSTIIDDSRNIVNAGIATVTSVSIGNTQVISSGRQLQNITSLDAVTTATIESAISNAPNTFSDLTVTGISTLGVTSATSLTAQQLNVSGVTTTTRLNVGTGGTVITTTSSGLVGIGTTNPTYKLDVRGDINTTYINSTGGGRIYEQLYLDLQNSADPEALAINGGSTGASFKWMSPSGNIFVGHRKKIFGGTSYDYTIAAETGLGFGVVTGGRTNYDFYINSSGNLGIGTTNPQYRTHIVGSNDILAVESTNTTARSTLKFITNGNDWEVGARGSASSPADAFYIFSNDYNIYAQVIDGFGNVLLGGSTTSTGTASQPLQVTGGAYVSGSVGIGTTNPTTTLQVNGTTKVETSIGSTQSVWTTTLDSKSGSLNNVGLLVQPESVYIGSGTYSPVVFSAGLSTSWPDGTIYGVQNYVNIAKTGSSDGSDTYGIYNVVARNSTSDTASSAFGAVVYVSRNDYQQGTNISSSSSSDSIFNTFNQSTISKGRVTSLHSNYNRTDVALGTGLTANVIGAYGSHNTVYIGAGSGTGFGTITSYYGNYVRPIVNTTGTLTNYYGLYLDTPFANGTLTNRWGIYSPDPITTSYHQGNIGIGTTNPTQKLEVSGEARIANRDSYFSAPGDLFSFPGLENDIKYPASSYEITEVQCVADVAGSLNNTYFTLYGPVGVNTAASGIVTSINTTLTEQLVVVWFNVAGAGTTPSVVGAGRSVGIAITTGASAVSIASSIATTFSTDVAFTVGNSGIGTVYFVANTPNNFTDSNAGTSGFAVTTTSNGSGSLSGTTKWVGGVLAPNGKIYGIPHSSTSVLVIDPAVGTATTFGSLSGTAKWLGGVLAPNGKIYGIPHSSTSVLVIDPAVGTATTFGSLSGTLKWYGGVLAPNGKIYGIPFSSTSVLVIDPATNTTSTFGSLSGTAKWIGGVLAPNGKIYGIPYDSTSVLVIDPATNTTSTFGSLSGTTKWVGGVLAPNGKIYGIPFSSTSVLVIDPAVGTATTFGSLSGTSKWLGGVLAPNGKIYGIPYSSTSVLSIGGGSAAIPNWYLSAYQNKL